MAVSPALRRALQRLFPDGRCDEAVVFKREYRVIEKRLAPEGFDETVVPLAIAATEFYIQWLAASAALRVSQDARTHGKGRRPSSQAIVRQMKRQSMQFASYTTAMQRLEALAASRRQRSPIDFFSEEASGE